MKKHFLLGAAALSVAAFALAVTPSAVAGSLAGVSATAATADPTFTGVCTLNGSATFSPNPLTATPQQGESYTFNGSGSCTGSLNGGVPTTYNASATASGSGTAPIGLSCSVSASLNGAGSITIDGQTIGFKISLVGTGPEVTFIITGNGGGVASGQASFATDTMAAAKCAAGASSLNFTIVATATDLSS